MNIVSVKQQDPQNTKKGHVILATDCYHFRTMKGTDLYEKENSWH